MLELETLPLADHLFVVALVLVVATVFGTWAFIVWRRRNNPSERERRRRSFVNARGRVTDGIVTDFDAVEEAGSRGLIHYTYSIGGVEYSAAQDISDLLDAIEGDASHIVGLVTVKYHPPNPFNSIVICEGWSGLRRKSRQSLGFR